MNSSINKEYRHHLAITSAALMVDNDYVHSDYWFEPRDPQDLVEATGRVPPRTPDRCRCHL